MRTAIDKSPQPPSLIRRKGLAPPPPIRAERVLARFRPGVQTRADKAKSVRSFSTHARFKKASFCMSSGYVPPHLRAGAAATETPPPRGGGGGYGDGNERFGSAGPRTGGYERGGDRGGYGDGRTGDYGGSFGGARRSQGDAGSSPAAGRDETPRGRGPPEAVFLDWKPAAHISSLTKEQVEDIRKRLDVIVDVEEGQPIAASPIECFEDMVRPAAACAALAAACVAAARQKPPQAPQEGPASRQP